MIDSWSAKTGLGSVRGPHLGPLHFGPEHNPDRISDFTIGERVVVHLEGTREQLRVLAVVPERQRQPPGTDLAAFDAVNAAHPSDAWIREHTSEVLELWLGHCCERCSDSWVVRFSQPDVHGLTEDLDLTAPFLRLASAAECEGREIIVPREGGRAAYCIVTDHGSGPDGPLVLIVADAVEVEYRPMK